MKIKNLHILIIENTLLLSELYRRFFTRSGYKISVACDADSALSMLEIHADIGLVIFDLDVDPENSLKTLSRFAKDFSYCPIIAVTGAASIGQAVDAMKAGASDFLIKPFQSEKLSKAIVEALEKSGGVPAEADDSFYEACIPAHSGRSCHDPYFGGFVGSSAQMRDLYNLIERAAKSDAGVFITGGSGTGKEICAEAIHKYSKRANHNFVALNCAAIPESLIESELFGHAKGAFTGATEERQGAAERADGGTLFLDEICEMHPDTQAKLLRFLQGQRFTKVGGDIEKKTDVRVICATNQDPMEAIRDGRFREDLYYRLHVVPIHMPTLKERGTDILDLAEFFLRRYSREEEKEFIRFSPEAENILMSYSWPGNVRQLENLIHQIVVLKSGSYVEAGMLPEYLKESALNQKEEDFENHDIPESNVSPMTLEDVERRTIMKAIDMYEGNITKAAEHLGVAPSTLYRKKTAWEKEQKSA